MLKYTEEQLNKLIRELLIQLARSSDQMEELTNRQLVSSTADIGSYPEDD